jgi:hypothetical protein
MTPEEWRKYLREAGWQNDLQRDDAVRLNAMRLARGEAYRHGHGKAWDRANLAAIRRLQGPEDDGSQCQEAAE